jgi:hypothetical protein
MDPWRQMEWDGQLMYFQLDHSHRLEAEEFEPAEAVVHHAGMGSNWQTLV